MIINQNVLDINSDFSSLIFITAPLQGDDEDDGGHLGVVAMETETKFGAESCFASAGFLLKLHALVLVLVLTRKLRNQNGKL